MSLQDPTLMKTFFGIAVSGLLGVIGGIATFFYEIDKKKRKFTWLGMFAMSVVAFVAGAIAGEFIPEGKNYYGLTMAVGVNAYPFFTLVHKQFMRFSNDQNKKS